jgi:hypothetical protein
MSGLGSNICLFGHSSEVRSTSERISREGISLDTRQNLEALVKKYVQHLNVFLARGFLVFTTARWGKEPTPFTGGARGTEHFDLETGGGGVTFPHKSCPLVSLASSSPPRHDYRPGLISHGHSPFENAQLYPQRCPDPSLRNGPRACERFGKEGGRLHLPPSSRSMLFGFVLQNSENCNRSNQMQKKTMIPKRYRLLVYG